MSEDMDKIASQVPGILNAGAAHMRKIAQQNVDLVRQNQALENEVRVMKLARRMEDRGLQNDLDYDEKCASLRDADDTKLASIESAVEIVAGGFSLGKLDNPADRGQKVATIQGENYNLNPGDEDPLNEFVLSGSAFS